MHSWERLIDSLSTRGANILILLIASGALFGGIIHVMHHGDHSEVATVIMSTFSGFSGALLNALVSGGKAVPSNPEKKDSL